MVDLRQISSQIKHVRKEIEEEHQDDKKALASLSPFKMPKVVKKEKGFSLYNLFTDAMLFILLVAGGISILLLFMYSLGMFSFPTF